MIPVKVIKCFSQSIATQKKIGNDIHILTWKYKWLSDKSIKPPATFDNSLALPLNYISVRSRRKFDGQYIKQDKVTFTYKNVVNICIVYELNLWANQQSNDFTLGNSLFGDFKLTKMVYCIWYWILFMRKIYMMVAGLVKT